MQSLRKTFAGGATQRRSPTKTLQLSLSLAHKDDRRLYTSVIHKNTLVLPPTHCNTDSQATHLVLCRARRGTCMFVVWPIKSR